MAYAIKISEKFKHLLIIIKIKNEELIEAKISVKHEQQKYNSIFVNGHDNKVKLTIRLGFNFTAAMIKIFFIRNPINIIKKLVVTKFEKSRHLHFEQVKFSFTIL